MPASRLAPSASVLPLAPLANKVPGDPQGGSEAPEHPRTPSSPAVPWEAGISRSGNARSPRSWFPGKSRPLQPREGQKGPFPFSAHFSENKTEMAEAAWRTEPRLGLEVRSRLGNARWVGGFLPEPAGARAVKILSPVFYLSPVENI